MTSRLLPLLFAAFCLLAGVRTASGQDATALWSEATAAAGDGEDARAVTLLAKLCEGFPNHALTDDALFLAGNLLEEKLGKPEDARRRYQELLVRFPDSRTALAAQRRLTRLDESLGQSGEGAEAYVQFQDILRGFPDREVEESIRRAKTLAEQNASWPQVHQIYLWLAATTRRTGDLPQASAHYRRVVDSEAPEDAQIQALLGMTEVAILRGRHGRAEELLESLEHRTDLAAAEKHAVAELWGLLGSSRQRKTLLWASGIAFLLVQLGFLGLVRRSSGSWKRALAALRKPTTEFYYMVPGAGLLIIMALTGHQEIGPAVAIICAGGLITTYLASAWLEQCKPIATSQAMLAASASVLATVSACYLALQRSQLLDLVATTVRFGPE